MKYSHCLWRPDVGTKASDIIPTLEAGLAKLEADPEHFKQFDAKNGWGVYPDFVRFVTNVLQACKQNPDAFIEVSR